METLIKNIQLLEKDNTLIPGALWLKDGRIHAIGTSFPEENFAEVIDGHHYLATPGFVDVHVHLREPGFTYKEKIATGSKAAARGGYTTICAMPNLNPVPDTPERLKDVLARNKQDGVVKVLQYAPITTGLKSEELVDMAALKALGAFAFTNDGVGVQTAGTMYLAMKKAAEVGLALVAHTEDNSLLFGGVMHEGHKNKELGLPGILGVTESSQIARDIMLAEATGVHYHVCHVSTKESVRVIRDAKNAGIHVTCEVTPHHLLLDEEDITEDHGYFKMNPPLRGTDDHQALIDGLLDGTIDCIATDHAPHGHEEKNQSMLKAPFGITGSETAFSLLYTKFVKTGVFTLQQLVDWLTVKPAAIFSLDAGTLNLGRPADLTLIDLATSRTIKDTDYVSMADNTPFTGSKIYGQPMMTFVDGQMVYKEEA